MPGQRLLILDDDAAVGQILALMGQSCGFATHWCETPSEFLQSLAEWQPTHLAIDLSLPGTTGVAVLGELAHADAVRRLADAGTPVRVIVCSGAGAAELDAAVLACHTLGLQAAGALPKPFRLAQVRALLTGAA